MSPTMEAGRRMGDLQGGTLAPRTEGCGERRTRCYVAPTMEQRSDAALRAMTDDGSFRVVVLRTTETVRAIAAAQGVHGDEARWLGELVTGTVLVRETMAPDLRVQGILQSSTGRGALVADSHPDGGTRGLVQRPKGSDLAFGDGAMLQMMRTLPRGGAQRGVVRVEGVGGVSASLMAYLLESEQVSSAIAVATITDGGEVRAAGGYLVQILPELQEAQLAAMTARLEQFPPMELLLAGDDAAPEALLAKLFEGMAYTRLAESAVGYQCRCDWARLRSTLSTLPKADVDELVAEGKDLEIECEYCHTAYCFPVAELLALHRVD